MTTTEFMQQIQERYGASEKDIHRQDIIETLKTLDDDERQKLWTLFLNHYNYQRPPRRGDFHRIMREYSIKERVFQSKWKYYYVCDTCGQSYSERSTACPKCKGLDRKLHQTDIIPGDIMHAHEECYRCKLYEPSLYCPFWGNKEGQVHPQCASCKCQKCCRAERLNKHDYQLYRQIMRDRPETLEEEVDKLADKHKFK